MNKISTFNWQESLSQTYEVVVKQFIEIAPQLLGAIALLIAGWIAACAMQAAAKKLVEGLDSLFKRAATIDGAKQERMKRSYAVIIGKLIFWIIMLFFITAAGNMLGWKMFSGWMDSIINYLPNLITGLLIILAGFLLGNGIRTTIISTADATGVEQSKLLGRTVQMLVFLTAIIVGASQTGINVGLLSNILIITIAVLLAGGALAFGLGAKTLIANIIGAQYMRKHCRIGEEIIIGEAHGVIAEVTETSIVLDTDGRRTVVPAKNFHECVSHFFSDNEHSNEI